MCGLAGVVSREPLADSVGLATRLDACLAHRGPDGAASWTSADRRVLLVHRRLAIIDPSPAGRQPMAAPGGTAWLAFNGEIYNYRALRAELEREGERFTTRSDTEVLLRWLLRRGPAALDRLRGMFALACWRNDERTLLLARDRFGIKPLYVAASDGRVAFASEIGALTGSGLVCAEPDPAGVLAFLGWGSIPPPLTWVTGIEAAAPGSWSQWSAAGARLGAGVFADVRRVWASGTGAGVRGAAWQEQVAETLRDSVRAHLVADVPVGVFLSSGLDSAALVARARSDVSDLRTFTVVVDEPQYSEAAGAEALAQRFETRHHTLRVDARNLAGDWPAIQARLDQPTIDGVNTYYVSRAVAATGTRAVLSGLGGDELFGGYPSFARLRRLRTLSRVAGPLVPLAARALALGAPTRGARLRHLTGAADDALEQYRVLRGFLMPDEIRGVAGARLADRSAAERVAAVERETMAAAGAERHAATVARLESTMYMRAQLLRDADAMSMAHGLEVRVPFVDAPLVAAVWPELGAHRALLARKRLLARLVPELPRETVRGPKRGFTLPFERWLSGPLADLVRSGLADLEADGWVARGTAARVWAAWDARRVHWSRPWGLAVLGRFLHDA
ncbi:MAG: asparagine synthase (glutamine-hydrolyzing) [Acidobacteriota bacterium]